MQRILGSNMKTLIRRKKEIKKSKDGGCTSFSVQAEPTKVAPNATPQRHGKDTSEADATDRRADPVKANPAW